MFRPSQVRKESLRPAALANCCFSPRPCCLITKKKWEGGGEKLAKKRLQMFPLLGARFFHPQNCSQTLIYHTKLLLLFSSFCFWMSKFAVSTILIPMGWTSTSKRSGLWARYSWTMTTIKRFRPLGKLPHSLKSWLWWATAPPPLKMTLSPVSARPLLPAPKRASLENSFVQYRIGGLGQYPFTGAIGEGGEQIAAIVYASVFNRTQRPA